MAKTLSPRDKQIIWVLSLEGKSQAKIAQLFDVSQSTISLVMKEMRMQNEINTLKNNNSSYSPIQNQPRLNR